MHADDMALVREFAANGSEMAFATLVGRYVNLVYSAAMRRLGNSQEAEEVAQAVFIILARKAGSLRQGTILSGWLYQTAQLTAANFHRAAVRRQRREQEAFMQFSEQSQPDLSEQRFGPLLEEAMARLGPKERDAVVLHYFEHCTVREVAAALGLGEAAAQKRVNRATEKLRDYFVRRGVQVSTAALLASLGTHAVHAAPAGLASKIAATAALKGAAGTGSTLTLIKTTLKIMAWTKVKTAVVAVTAVILTTGTTTVVVKYMATGRVPIFGTSIDDSFFEANVQKLQSAPANVLILRPTRSSRISGPLRISGRKGAEPNSTRLSGRCVSLESVLETAYGFQASRIILPPDMPKENFDFLVTVPGNSREQLQAEITKQLGLVARREQRDQEVFLLRLSAAGARGLKPGSGGSSHSGFYAGEQGKYAAKNAPISALAGYLEQNALKQIVVDQTGLTGRYDYELDGRVFNSEQELRGALLTQLGLELVPSREPVEMLVVEKATP